MFGLRVIPNYMYAGFFQGITDGKPWIFTQVSPPFSIIGLKFVRYKDPQENSYPLLDVDLPQLSLA